MVVLNYQLVLEFASSVLVFVSILSFVLSITNEMAQSDVMKY